MKLLFCKLGLHWRMTIKELLFLDVIAWKRVYSAVCPCGRNWMVDSLHGFPLFKVERERSNR